MRPRYWLWWGIGGLLWCLTCLPYRWQLFSGRQLGKLAYRLAPRRRKIAAINLKLCFPELSESQQHDLVCRHFESLGMGLIETASAWWSSDEKLQSLGHFEGLEHLRMALTRGKGVILLSAHFCSLEMGSRLLTFHTPIHGTYRPHENPVLGFLMKTGREKHAEKIIPREAIRDMLRSLKANKPLWFASDQNFGHKHSVFAEFFGILAATNTTPLRLVQMSDAAVIPFFTQRLPENQGYKVLLLPPLTNFPSGDTLADARYLNHLIETQVRRAPEQYLWVHRRFKDRPEGEPAFYGHSESIVKNNHVSSK